MALKVLAFRGFILPPLAGEALWCTATRTMRKSPPAPAFKALFTARSCRCEKEAECRSCYLRQPCGWIRAWSFRTDKIGILMMNQKESFRDTLKLLWSLGPQGISGCTMAKRSRSYEIWKVSSGNGYSAIRKTFAVEWYFLRDRQCI